MTTSHLFYESVFATQYRVLGVKLPPLSLWHLAALDAVESPFVTWRGNVCLGDIQIAVQICRTRWPKRPDIRPTLWTRLQNLALNRNERYVRGQAEMLAAHIAHHCIYPPVWSDEGGKPIGCPPQLNRVVSLLALNVGLSEAWNDISPGMASWMIAAEAERQGQLSITSDKEHAIMERMKKEVANG